MVIPNLTLPGNPGSNLILVTEIEIQFVFPDESRKLPRIITAAREHLPSAAQRDVFRHSPPIPGSKLFWDRGFLESRLFWNRGFFESQLFWNRGFCSAAFDTAFETRFLKRGFLRHGVLKRGFLKHGFLKRGFFEHGLLRHGF